MNGLAELTVNPKGFLFNPSGGEMFTVNPAGLEIIKGLQAQKSFEMIAVELSNIFQVTLDRVEKDIFDFKSQLRVFHLL